MIPGAGPWDKICWRAIGCGLGLQARFAKSKISVRTEILEVTSRPPGDHVVSRLNRIRTNLHDTKLKSIQQSYIV